LEEENRPKIKKSETKQQSKLVENRKIEAIQS
jgi:hypothetical protein